MHNEFTVNEINTEMRNKTITVNFAYDIDPASINDSTIQIRMRNSNEPVDYKANVEGRVVHIVLLNWPEPNQEYILRIEKLKDILGNELESAARRKVTFKSNICSTINIISPSFNELLNDIYIKWEEIKSDESHQLVNSYLIEIATDTNFYKLANSSYVQDKQEIILNDLSDGQYFLRIRAQKDDQYGFWSETVSFIVKNKKEELPQDKTDDDPIFIKPIQMLCYPTNGETPESFLFEFDCPIDSDFLDDIIVIRKEF